MLGCAAKAATVGVLAEAVEFRLGLVAHADDAMAIQTDATTRGTTLSERARRTKTVFDAAKALVEAGSDGFRPGDVASHLRDAGTPVGAWEVRGELTTLERCGLVALDEDTAVWHLIKGATFSIEATKAAANGKGRAHEPDDVRYLRDLQVQDRKVKTARVGN